MRNRNTPDDFWRRVDQAGDCWVWTGSKTPHGYGTVRWAGDVRQVRALAPQVIAANRELDQIVEAARVRVPVAHTHTKRIASVVETVLTGRTR